MVYVLAEEREIVLMRLGDDRHLGYGDPDVMIGKRVGSFTIVRLIGERGTGKVHVAEHAVRKIPRTGKLLSPQLTENRGERRGQTSSREAVLTGQPRVRLTDDDVDQGKATTITVAPDKTATLERNW